MNALSTGQMIQNIEIVEKISGYVDLVSQWITH